MAKQRKCWKCGAPIVTGKFCHSCTQAIRAANSNPNSIKIADILAAVRKMEEVTKKFKVQCWFCDNEFFKITKPVNVAAYAAQCYYGNICCSHCLSGFYADKIRKLHFYHHSMPVMAYFLEVERLKSEVDKDLELAEKAFNENLEIKGNTMLFVHYENISVLGRPYVKLKFSTSGMSAQMNGASNFKLVKECVDYLKQIPATSRTFEPGTLFWTIPTSNFTLLKGIYIKLDKVPDTNFILHTDLKRWNAGLEGVVLEHEKVAPKPEDFFYSTAQPVGQPKVDIETARKTLVDFLIRESIQVFENGDIAKSYKIAARKLHPDLNGGDASKMTELNFLFQQYKSLV